MQKIGFKHIAGTVFQDSIYMLSQPDGAGRMAVPAPRRQYKAAEPAVRQPCTVSSTALYQNDNNTDFARHGMDGRNV